MIYILLCVFCKNNERPSTSRIDSGLVVTGTLKSRVQRFKVSEIKSYPTKSDTHNRNISFSCIHGNCRGPQIDISFTKGKRG